MFGTRLYCLDNGQIQFDISVFRPSLPRGVRGWGPIPTFLIQHPQGLVLVDTGCHPAVAEDAEHWGGIARAMHPKVSRENLATHAVQAIGFDPRYVDIVINTHLHMDHAGGNQLFPDATFLVQQSEYAFASAQEGRGYFRTDWDHPLNYRLLDEPVHDVFGDGAIVVRKTGGHTPGHQIVEVSLDQTGKVILAADVIPFRANLEGEVPRNNLDAEATISVATYIRNEVAKGATVIYGHDGDAWNDVPKPPRFYE